LTIGLQNGIPVVEREVLKYRRGQRGQPWRFLDFSLGHGEAVTNEEDYGKPDAAMKRDHQELESPDILAIKGLGQFQRFKAVSSFRRLIEDWLLGDLDAVAKAFVVPDYQKIGGARAVAPLLSLEKNRSQSIQLFVRTVRSIASAASPFA